MDSGDVCFMLICRDDLDLFDADLRIDDLLATMKVMKIGQEEAEVEEADQTGLDRGMESRTDTQNRIDKEVMSNEQQ